ncbi:CHC2 zinc finger domain-containing protein, partial [Thomasclavelia ramosa]|uniref:CHC2 zinc finger domain-containing protein n=1 Tax=Thomasclavelia ramosa TaxID=1547 RepID=UPI001D009E87
QAAEYYGVQVGRNGMACCPFHDDKHPSMKIDHRFHCFGCQADGDVIDFIAALYRLGKKEAALQIANDFGLSYEDWKQPGKTKKPKPR